jgi:hypothetical protein
MERFNLFNDAALEVDEDEPFGLRALHAGLQVPAGHKRCGMALGRRLREIASVIRAARFPAPPATKPGDVGGYTGEGSLIRSWMRDAERGRKRADAGGRR